MALCPKCYGILNFWNVKAECPYCGVNIPNYNWEERLDQDAEHAIVAWKSFRRFTSNLKSALFGSKIRIVRFICTFLPLVALVLPLANYSITLPFLTRSGESFTLLDFTLNKFLTLNWGSLISLATADNLGIASLLLILSVFLLYFAVVFGVLNFIFVLLRAPKLKAGFNITMCVLSTLCFTVAAALFTICVSLVSNTSIGFITGSVQYGIFVGIALFGLNVVLNTLTNKGFRKQRTDQN
jgi:hypothetical protein